MGHHQSNVRPNSPRFTEVDFFRQNETLLTMIWNPIMFSEDSDGLWSLEFSATTKLMKFTDDVVVDIRKTSNGCLAAFRSRSRIGRNDWNANHNRIALLIKQAKLTAVAAPADAQADAKAPLKEKVDE
jgi:hypothetical protein